jgi:hypothetical protein
MENILPFSHLESEKENYGTSAKKSRNEINPESIQSNDDPPLPSYYMKNFNFMLDNTLAQHQHIFDKDEMEIIQQFKKMTENSQRLFVRLFQRKVRLLILEKFSICRDLTSEIHK